MDMPGSVKHVIWQSARHLSEPSEGRERWLSISTLSCQKPQVSIIWWISSTPYRDFLNTTLKLV